MYVPLEKVRVPAANFRRAVPALIFCIGAFVVALAAGFMRWRLTSYYAFQASMGAIMLYFTLAVPWMMLAVALILGLP